MKNCRRLVVVLQLGGGVHNDDGNDDIGKGMEGEDATAGSDAAAAAAAAAVRLEKVQQQRVPQQSS